MKTGIATIIIRTYTKFNSAIKDQLIDAYRQGMKISLYKAEELGLNISVKRLDKYIKEIDEGKWD